MTPNMFDVVWQYRRLKDLCPFSARSLEVQGSEIDDPKGRQPKY